MKGELALVFARAPAIRALHPEHRYYREENWLYGAPGGDLPAAPRRLFEEAAPRPCPFSRDALAVAAAVRHAARQSSWSAARTTICAGSSSSVIASSLRFGARPDVSPAGRLLSRARFTRLLHLYERVGRDVVGGVRRAPALRPPGDHHGKARRTATCRPSQDAPHGARRSRSPAAITSATSASGRAASGCLSAATRRGSTRSSPSPGLRLTWKSTRMPSTWRDRDRRWAPSRRSTRRAAWPRSPAISDSGEAGMVVQRGLSRRRCLPRFLPRYRLRFTARSDRPLRSPRRDSRPHCGTNHFRVTGAARRAGQQGAVLIPTGLTRVSPSTPPTSRCTCRRAQVDRWAQRMWIDRR